MQACMHACSRHIGRLKGWHVGRITGRHAGRTAFSLNSSKVSQIETMALEDTVSDRQYASATT